jgi:HD-GYP domain-containing protein (c-di-GMP phosphodiesterase class II)
MARSLLESLRVRDPYTAGHCIRVGYYSKLLARSAGLNEYEQKVVEYSGIFHDVGKIGIPEHILNKPGKLTPEEELIMQEHPVKSVQIIRPLAHVPFFRATLPGIKHHHERIDGKGYPENLQGEIIPLVARIILIADTYDAMTSTRVYRKGLSDAIAYDELKKFAGQQFDETLVKVFLDSHPKWKMKDEETDGDRLVSNLFRQAA